MVAARAVTVSAIGAGVVLSAAGEAIAFIPNENWRAPCCITNVAVLEVAHDAFGVVRQHREWSLAAWRSLALLCTGKAEDFSSVYSSSKNAFSTLTAFLRVHAA
jgi:hypothetical protein